MKNQNITTLDTHQIIKRVICAETEAVRVIQAHDTQHEIHISAEQNDSIQAVARTKSIQESDGIVDCSSLRRISLYGFATVEVSPLAEGNVWQQVVISDGQIKEICAVRIKVSGEGILVGQS